MDKKQAQKLIKETFESPFDKNRFIGFVKNLLNHIQEDTFNYHGKYIPASFKSHIKSYERIGKYYDVNNRIDILIVNLNKESLIERARVTQRNFIAGYLEGKYGSDKPKDAALVAFVSPEQEDWRFSLVKMDYRFEEGKHGRMRVKEEFTPARRWSFLVGANENSHTAQSQLVDILADDENNPTFAQLEEAFNIEKVTKEFLNKYRELYRQLSKSIDKILSEDKNVKEEFENKKISAVNFSKKLLGQIVFLYFLQKKGWLGAKEKWGDGDKKFLKNLFIDCKNHNKNFFNDYLEYLFYDALNNEHRGGADPSIYPRFDCKIPFLNGGLFEPINNYNWKQTDIIIPDTLFSNTERTKEDIGTGILDVFDRFNFTVREDEPLEKEVALDPELLGKVFENLIEENLRKGQGAYYTPREIVHYMCQESLINYLHSELNQGAVSYETLGEKQLDAFGNTSKQGQHSLVIEHGSSSVIPKEDIEILIKYGDITIEHDKLAMTRKEEDPQYNGKYKKMQIPETIKDNAKLIDDKLKNIRVCDPAVGSGAFPIGMMLEIVKARNVLTNYLVIARNESDKAISLQSRTPYTFKRQCIENCLYGVDIDSSAIDIAKLRFWLSLVVDEEDLTRIQPLPNLDYKLVCGNSLLGVRRDLLNAHLFKELEELKPLHFNETDTNKKLEFKKQIDKLIKQITNNDEHFDFEIYFSEVFHEKGGFDVVIANPPYLGEKGHKEMFREIKHGSLGKFYQGKMDLFYFFFHLALNLGNNNSQVAFISTNYYITALGARKLREDFKNRAVVRKLVNFNELKIFKSATGQHNMVTILAKGQDNEAIAKTCITKRTGDATSEILNKIVSWQDDKTDYYAVAQQDLYDGDECCMRLAGNSTTIINPIQIILEKVKNQSEDLMSLCNVNCGIQTGCDEIKIGGQKQGVFILSDEEIKAFNNEERKLIKPFFNTSDIHKYFVDLKNNSWVIYSDRNIDTISKYKNLHQHFNKKEYRKVLDNIREVKNGRIKYFQLQWPRNEEIFKGEKIVCSQRSGLNIFGYSNGIWYGGSGIFFITKKNESIFVKYILALINSKLYYLWLYHRGKRKGETLELIAKPLSEIPIKKISEDEQKPFIEIVDKILAIKAKNPEADISALESQIDQMVYKLYGLTKNEVEIIEGKV